MNSLPGPQPPASPSRPKPLLGGLSLLLLVALAAQLPTLMATAINLSRDGTQWAPIRLVAQPVVWQQARVVRRERVVPSAAEIATRRKSTLIALGAAPVAQPLASSADLLGNWLLDLPPPSAL